MRFNALRGLPVLGAVLLVTGATTIALPSSAGAAPMTPAAGGPPTPTCTDSWTGTAGGTWNTAADWSTDTVPGSGDVACIGSAGTSPYTVILEGSEAAGTVVVGASNGKTKATLELQGNPTDGDANLTVGSVLQVDKGGSVDMTSLGNGNVFLHGGTVTNYGTFETSSGNGWSRYLDAGVVNEKGGKFEVSDAATPGTGGTYQSGGDFTNDGTVTVASSSEYDLRGGSFDLVGGKISLAKATKKKSGGIFQLDGVSATLAGGKETGSPVQLNGGSITDSAGTGSYAVDAGESVSGTIPKGQTITVIGNGSDVTLAVDGTVTNDGTVVLTSGPSGAVGGNTGGSNSWLTPGTGAPSFVNDGTLQFLPGIGWTRYLTVSLQNRPGGMFDLSGPDNQATSASVTNAGTVSLGDGAKLNLVGTSYGPSSFVQDAGGTLGVTLDGTTSSEIDQFGCSAGGCQSEGIVVAGTLQVTTVGSPPTGSWLLLQSQQTSTQGSFGTVTPAGYSAQYNHPVAGDISISN